MTASAWESFFRSGFGPLQENGLRVEDAGEEASFIAQTLEIRPGARVLDVPCGAGRHTVALAKKGYLVTGIDANAGAIKKAEEAVVPISMAGKAEFIQGDMRKLPELVPAAAFDAAFCFWGSFGYFSDTENRRFLKGLCKILRPGGRFLLDISVMETILPQFDRDRDTTIDLADHSVRIIERREWDIGQSRIHTSWQFHADDSTSAQYSTSLRIYGFRELRDLLNSVGLVFEMACETVTGKPAEISSDRLTFVCRKAAG